MAVTYQGVTSPVPGPTSSGDIDDAGLQTSREVEKVKVANLSTRLSTLAGQIGTATTSKITGGILRSVTWQEEPGGLAEITKTFRSSGLTPGEDSGPDPGDPDEDIPGDRWTLEATTQEQPILTHPAFDALTDDELTTLKLWAVGNVEEAEASEAESPTALYLKAREYILNETTGFLSPSFVLKRQGVTARETLTWENIGKIVTPPASTKIPGLFGSSQTWLFAGQSAVSFGSGQLEFEQTYLGSGMGGWDTFLYD
jgi:hypothetical protein